LFNIDYSNALEDYSAEIIPLIKPERMIINMGPCLILDSIRADFIIKNTGLKGLYMEPLFPTFYLGAIPNDLSFNFNLFKRKTELPKIFPSNTSDTLTIQFIAGDTVETKPGWHDALVGLAFFKEETQTVPTISKIDTFLLKVKKTMKYFDGFDDNINFDSVYVNPTNMKTMVWRGRNVYKDSILIKNRELKYITQPQNIGEFKFYDSISDLDVITDGIVKWTVSYYPVDMGFDSLKMKVNFIPKPDIKPDSVDFINVMILGTGVKQKIEITNSKNDFSGDTILVGNIRSGEKKDIEFLLKNNGNIPVNSIKEELIDEFSGSESKDIILVTAFKDNKNYFYPDSLKKIFLEYNPKELGAFLIKYRITTDLTERNIYGVPESQKYCLFYLKGSVVSPKLAVSSNIIDFGNVMINKTNCLSVRDTILRISNIGNDNLIISHIVVIPETNFKISSSTFELAPYKDTTIKITFTGNSGTIGESFAELRIASNQRIPSDTTVIQLKAKSVSSITGNLSISDSIKAKPGTMIEVPVVLKNDFIKPSIFASKFTSDLSYNQTMLKYQGVKTLGTASEGALNLGDNTEITEKNHITIDLQMPSGTYFKSSDTIALLRFDTFLGDAVSCELAFSNPKFGDNNCEEVFGLNVINGIMTTDSVCGIGFKAVPKPKSKYYIKVFQDVFLENKIKFEISIPVKIENTLDLYDIYGNKTRNIFKSELPAGVYSSYLNTADLNSGIYYLLLTNKFYQAIQPVIILR
jgi:hypothetical protein